MLRNTLDLMQPHLAVAYLRMSDPGQNERSPTQQLEMIKSRMERMRYPWQLVKTYTDAGLTGRLQRNRAGYQRMLREIKSGLVSPKLILVDTIERFGRIEELGEIRRKLYTQSRILILTADTNFADPTTEQGRSHALLEEHRATADSRVKAHNVLRGKYDAIRQGYWPGGPVPFGYELKLVKTEIRKGRRYDHHTLAPAALSSPVILMLYQQALATGWGQTLLTRWLNEHPGIPDSSKPFHEATVGSWLDNPIYYGELVYDKYSTGILGDTRILERNKEEDIIRVPNFCEAIVPKELAQAVQGLRRRRKRAAESGTSDARIPGIVYHYPLSGLVRCKCGASMLINSSSPYTTRDGEIHRYAYYACPENRVGICSNSTRVPEDWLRAQIIGKLRERLFPATDPEK